MSRSPRPKPGEDPDFPFLAFDQRIEFPNPAEGPGDGPIAHGGNLSPGMLLSAYEQGVFPWFSEGEPIWWWSPDPRFVVFPEEAHVSQSMRKILRQGRFEIRFDTAFEQVIRSCSRSPRPNQSGTWITESMIEAYLRLHAIFRAHSVEAWLNDQLVGGLYGVSLGSIFCGESMFSSVPNASKAAFLTIAAHFRKEAVPVIDSQVHTDYVESLGARHIPRDQYLHLVARYRDSGFLNTDWRGRFGAIVSW